MFSPVLVFHNTQYYKNNEEPMNYLSIAIIAASLLNNPLHAGEDYLSGNIINLTSVTSGLMIMLDSGIPNNCRGTPYGWILIKEENKAITSVALTMWASGKKVGPSTPHLLRRVIIAL